MAARTREAVQPGGIHVLKSYKIHVEQIAKIAREFKERYHVRRPDSPRSVREEGNVQEQSGKNLSPPRLRVRKTIWETGPVKGLVSEGPDSLLPKMETPGRTVTAIRCFRCGVDFPVPDFLYTKKSGLCIDCWEEMVI
jgi:hypothetical protein